MRFFLISDNNDALIGMRLAGIEGVVARSEADLKAGLAQATAAGDVGVLLVTEKIADAYEPILAPLAGAQSGPLLITVPSTGGSAAGKDRITRYVREAVGIKI